MDKRDVGTADPRDTPLEDDGQEIMRLVVKEIKRRLTDPVLVIELKAADFEMIRKLLADNAITLSSVKAGNFGEYARNLVEENFPFEVEGPEIIN